MCRTYVWLWDHLYFWWNANCLNNSFPWVQMLAVLKTWTFRISQNILRCVLLHPLRIVLAFSALDHSPCARMIWILTTILILFRRLQWRIDLEDKQRVSPFFCDFLLLPKWRSCVHERNVFETRALLLEGKQRVSPFYRTSQLANSEDVDFRIWSSPGFLMK